MMLFRVHFEGSEPIDVSAETPAQARKEAAARRPEAVIRKIKIVREDAV
jgi:hypothetical protein